MDILKIGGQLINYTLQDGITQRAEIIKQGGLLEENAGVNGEILLKERVFNQSGIFSPKGTTDIISGKKSYEVKVFTNGSNANFMSVSRAIEFLATDSKMIFLFIIDYKVFSMKAKDLKAVIKSNLEQILEDLEARNYAPYFRARRANNKVDSLMLATTSKALQSYAPYMKYEKTMTKLLAL